LNPVCYFPAIKQILKHAKNNCSFRFGWVRNICHVKEYDAKEDDGLKREKVAGEWRELRNEELHVL